MTQKNADSFPSRCRVGQLLEKIVIHPCILSFIHFYNHITNTIKITLFKGIVKRFNPLFTPLFHA